MSLFIVFFSLSLSPAPSLSMQDEEWYEPSTDVRAQLRFFEQLDRMEKQRKDEQEREVLLKAAKVATRTTGLHAHRDCATPTLPHYRITGHNLFNSRRGVAC